MSDYIGKQDEEDIIMSALRREAAQNGIAEGGVARLREHIEGIRRIIVSARDYKEWEKVRSVLVSAEWACDEALSSSGDTEPVGEMDQMDINMLRVILVRYDAPTLTDAIKRIGEEEPT